jgi:large subunit ribosomal protein L25
MDVTLAAETRSQAGSRPTNRLRGEGKVPGVVYGLGAEPASVVVSWPELRRALSTDAGANALITLEYDGRSDLTIVKDMQRDPVRRSVLHVDFLRVDRDEIVDIEVPIMIVGEAKEVENNRGIAEQSMKSITVQTKPATIPSHFEVDITDLTVGTSITVSQLVLPEGVTTEADPDAAIVSGVATRFSEEAEVAEGEEGEGEEGVEGEEGAAASGAEGSEGSADAAEGGE